MCTPYLGIVHTFLSVVPKDRLLEFENLIDEDNV